MVEGAVVIPPFGIPPIKRTGIKSGGLIEGFLVVQSHPCLKTIMAIVAKLRKDVGAG